MDKSKEKRAIEYLHAFERMLIARAAKGLENRWRNGEEVMKWWVGDDPDQIELGYTEEWNETAARTYSLRGIAEGVHGVPPSGA